MNFKLQFILTATFFAALGTLCGAEIVEAVYKLVHAIVF